MKMKKRFLSILLSLVLVLGLMTGMSLTAYAADTWNENFTTGNGTINVGVTVSADITLTIPEGKTLTVNGGGQDGYGIDTGGNTLTVAGGGTLIVNGLKEGYGISGIGINGNVIVNGASITVTGATGEDNSDFKAYGGDGIYGNLTVNSGSATVKGGNGGNQDSDNGGWGGCGVAGTVTVKNGSVNITGGNGGNSKGPYSSNGNGGDGGTGIKWGNLIVEGGSAIVTGGNGGTKGSSSMASNGYRGNAVSNTITGTTKQESDDGSNWNDISESKSQKQYVKVKTPPHTHSFTYSASGATITATCGAANCGLTDSKTTLTIDAPTMTVYQETGKSAAATLTGLDAFNTATSKAIATTEIKYVGRDGTSYDESTTAPNNAGKYTAKITVEGQTATVDYEIAKTATVDYEIAKAATTVTTAPTAGEITYGKTLADSTLTGGTASKEGTFAWKDSTIVPAVSDSQKTEYDVVFTPTDGNYATAECKVKLTVIKADASRDVPEKALPYTGQPQELVTAGTVSGGTLQYALGTDDVTAPADGWSTEIPTATEPGKYFIWYRVVGDENHNGVDPACIVVTIAEPIPEETPAAAPAAPESVSDYTLLASMKTSGNKAFKLKWTAVTGAEGYDVFLGRVGKEVELKTSVNGTSCKIGKLKKGKAYRAFVKAWRTENGQKVYIGQASPDVYAITGGQNNRYTNPKKITVKKKKLTVAVGGSKKIKASLKKFSNSRRYLKRTAKIRYFSSNRAVATVNAKGKVTGVAPGTCTVYAVAENGLRKGVKITVK